jgi:hypothetical protein
MRVDSLCDRGRQAAGGGVYAPSGPDIWVNGRRPEGEALGMGDARSVGWVREGVPLRRARFRAQVNKGLKRVRGLWKGCLGLLIFRGFFD